MFHMSLCEFPDKLGGIQKKVRSTIINFWILKGDKLTLNL